MFSSCGTSICSSVTQCDDNDSVLAEADGENTDIGIMTDVSSEDEYIPGDWNIGYQSEIIDGVTVYYGGDLDDSEDSEWEDPEDIARRAYVEEYNFDLLGGMQPLVFVPSHTKSRTDRCKSRETYLIDGQDNRIVVDDSIVDQERESWRKYCASLFHKGLAKFPSDAAVSPPTSVYVKDRHERADITDMTSPECAGQEVDIGYENKLVSEDEEESRGSDIL